MARRKLSKTVVDALKPKARGEFTLWDEDPRRFGVRVLSSGSKLYVLRLMVDGRQRWYTIGRHGDPWTVDTARDEAKRVLGQSENVKKLRQTGAAPANLLHPVEARERARAAPTVAEFAERYLEEHAVPFKAPATVGADRGLLGLPQDPAEDYEPKARTIVAEVGRLRVDRVTRADIVRLHLAWADTPTRANRAVALLSHMLTKAEEWGVRTDGNPCRRVERFKETKRERFLSAAELGRLGGALAELEAENDVTPFGLAAIRLLVFSGARASEVLGLTWKAVDLSGGAVRLKRKGRISTLYLPPPALKVLKQIPRLGGNPHVIAGGKEGRPLTLSGLEQVWQVVRDRAKLKDVRMHDLRHSFASVAAEGGASLPIIGALLGHTQPQTTARYAHLAGDPLKVAAKAVGDRIAAAMRPKRKRGNVVPHRRRAGQ